MAHNVSLSIIIVIHVFFDHTAPINSASGESVCAKTSGFTCCILKSDLFRMQPAILFANQRSRLLVGRAEEGGRGCSRQPGDLNTKEPARPAGLRPPLSSQRAEPAAGLIPRFPKAQNPAACFSRTEAGVTDCESKWNKINKDRIKGCSFSGRDPDSPFTSDKENPHSRPRRVTIAQKAERHLEGKFLRSSPFLVLYILSLCS